MARTKNLDTLVRSERKRISMVPGQFVLQPRGRTPVQLKEGGWSEVDVPKIMVETEGEYNMGMYSRLYDPEIPEDAEVLRLVAEYIEDHPEQCNAVDFQLKIVGEYSANEPWPGYDDQNAEQVEAYWRIVPDIGRPDLKDVMKHELDRIEPDDEKIKVLNKLHREVEQSQKDAAEDTVAM